MPNPTQFEQAENRLHQLQNEYPSSTIFSLLAMMTPEFSYEVLLDIASQEISQLRTDHQPTVFETGPDSPKGIFYNTISDILNRRWATSEDYDVIITAIKDIDDFDFLVDTSKQLLNLPVPKTIARIHNRMNILHKKRKLIESMIQDAKKADIPLNDEELNQIKSILISQSEDEISTKNSIRSHIDLLTDRQTSEFDFDLIDQVSDFTFLQNLSVRLKIDKTYSTWLLVHRFAQELGEKIERTF